MDARLTVPIPRYVGPVTIDISDYEQVGDLEAPQRLGVPDHSLRKVLSIAAAFTNPVGAPSDSDDAADSIA